MSGYCDCACRDCFEIAITSDETKPAFCHACVDAGCPDYQGQPGMSQECQREDAYASGEPTIEDMRAIAGQHNAQVWIEETANMTCAACGETTEMPRGHEACGSCGRNDVTVAPTGRHKWFWWTCCPGCLPDSDVSGPYDTETDALENATDGLY